jgi:hypothetical protein
VSVRILEDGTRLYSNRTRYTPVPEEQRKNFVRKPDDPRAVRWGGHWVLPLDLLGEDQRQLPETRPDSEAFDHMVKPRACRCDVCKRPEAKRWKRMWRRQMRRVSSASA